MHKQIVQVFLTFWLSPISLGLYVRVKNYLAWIKNHAASGACVKKSSKKKKKKSKKKKKKKKKKKGKKGKKKKG